VPKSLWLILVSVSQVAAGRLFCGCASVPVVSVITRVINICSHIQDLTALIQKYTEKQRATWKEDPLNIEILSPN
jgi:hypothetical protein